MPLSNYAGDLVLDFFLGGEEITPPTSLKLKLYTSMPSVAGTGGTQVAGNNYSPAVITADPANFTGTGKTRQNADVVVFPQASGAWGAVVGIVVTDQDDNPILLGTFATPRNVVADDVLSFTAGQITFTGV